MVVRRVVAAPMASLCLSAVTEAELRYGLAKRPDATRLHRVVGELLLRLDVLPWDSAVALAHGAVRAGMERQGKVLAARELMIAAHAIATGCTLVSNDPAFAQVPNIDLEDWTIG